jgi:hypothetical protein
MPPTSPASHGVSTAARPSRRAERSGAGSPGQPEVRTPHPSGSTAQKWIFCMPSPSHRPSGRLANTRRYAWIEVFTGRSVRHQACRLVAALRPAWRCRCQCSESERRSRRCAGPPIAVRARRRIRVTTRYRAVTRRRQPSRGSGLESGLRRPCRPLTCPNLARNLLTAVLRTAPT